MNAHPPPEGWKHLSERARWELAHPDQSSPLLATSNLVLQLRLWSYPRRGAQVSWGLFLPLWRDAEARVRESRWDEPSDRRRLSSRLETLRLRHHYAPSLRLRDAIVDTVLLEPFMVQAPDVLSPWASPEAADAVSGRESFGIEGFRSLTHAYLEWRREDEDAPEGPVAWVVRLRELLRSSLDERKTA